MPDADRLARYAARLLLDWLNERFGAELALSDAQDEAFLASDGAHRVALYVAPLWEREAATAWEERLRAVEQRLSGAVEGAYILWVPPGADVPGGEPGTSEFAERVVAAARSLEPGARTEVMLPGTVRMGKLREEGGYASVIGGLSRWWTRITEQVQGTFQVDSSAVHRITHDGDARERLWERIGEIAKGVALSEAVEFEIDQAWTLQRLPQGEEPGFLLVGAPPSVDPTDGVLVRRTARRRLQAANEALAGVEAELRAVALVGCYEYAEMETAGATVKALDPSLYTPFEVVCVLVDGEVRPTFAPRALPWAG